MGENSEAAEAPKRRSPAEAFDELKAAVNRSASEISDLWDFTQKVKDKLFKAAEVHRMEGMLPVLESFLQIHQIVYTAVSADDEGAGGDEAASEDKFVGSLLETIEEELARHRIQVLKPKLGDAFQVQLMDCLAAVPGRSRKDKPNTIASVKSCGFTYLPPTGGAKRLLAKAQVEVFGK